MKARDTVARDTLRLLVAACKNRAVELGRGPQGDLSDEEKVTREAALTKKYNAAVQEMELIAARFNEQVRDYKDKD